MGRLSWALLLVSCAHAPVMTDRGPVLGSVQSGVQIFKGIPYAAAPVGALRWKAPVPPPAWADVRDATRPGPACMQPTKERVVSEDCLSLNVWAPEHARALPVMVWIHGGGFFENAASDLLWDGAKLAATAGVVVVNMNYRLGALGFLAERHLGAASAGLLDQQAALKWVQANIERFGGDPSNVTLFGGSAGAWSTCSQMAMPSSRGLFHKAIMESGACSDTLYFDRETALAQGDQFAKALGCDSLECLQNVPAQKVVDALPMKRSMLLPPGVYWGPVVDGEVLPEMPIKAITSKKTPDLPLLIGWARDEGVIHTAGLQDVTDDEIAGFIREHFGERAAIEMPPRFPAATRHLALDDVVTEGVFVCGARRIANAFVDRGLPVFAFELTHGLDDEAAHHWGPTHSVEMFFVFGNEDRVVFTEREKAFSSKVMTLWGRFAQEGTPGGGWPRWSRADERYLELDLEPVARAHPRPGRCDAWDAVER